MIIFAASVLFTLFISAFCECPGCGDGTCCSGTKGVMCCPFPQGVCCSDEHCCPHGSKCNSSLGECENKMAALVSPINDNVNHTTGKNITVIVAQQRHTDQRQVHESKMEETTSIKNVVEVTNEEMNYTVREEKSKDPEIVQCNDFYYCSLDSTCCNHPNNTFGCCPYPDGVCCPDNSHCCKRGYTCSADCKFCHRRGIHKYKK